MSRKYAYASATEQVLIVIRLTGALLIKIYLIIAIAAFFIT